MVIHYYFILFRLFLISLSFSLSHQRLDCRVAAKLCLSLTSFRRYTDSPGFLDFVYLNENACLVTFDNLSILSKNLPAIASRTYRFVKKEKIEAEF